MHASLVPCNSFETHLNSGLARRSGEAEMHVDESNIIEMGGEVFDVYRNNQLIFSSTGLRGDDNIDTEGRPLRFVAFALGTQLEAGDRLREGLRGEDGGN